MAPATARRSSPGCWSDWPRPACRPDRPRIRLLCFPRVLGYAFNPISVYFCYEGERLAAVRLRGQEHLRRPACLCVRCPPRRQRRPAGSAFLRQEFYVSPFIDMVARYDFHVAAAGRSAGASSIRESEHGEPLLIASQVGERLPLTDAVDLALPCRRSADDVQGFRRHPCRGPAAMAEGRAPVCPGVQPGPGRCWRNEIATMTGTPQDGTQRWRRARLPAGIAVVLCRCAGPGPGAEPREPALSRQPGDPSAGRHHAPVPRRASDGPQAVIQLRNGRVARRYLTGGSVGFAEGYIEGDWDTPDLADAAGPAQRQRACLERRVLRRALAALAAPRAALAAGEHASAAAGATSMPITISATSSSPLGSTRR